MYAKKVLRQPHNVLTLQVSLSLRALGGFSFHRSYKHTIYCATKLVSPYVFFFAFRIARSRTVWVDVIFKARFQPRAVLVFFSFVGEQTQTPTRPIVINGCHHQPIRGHFSALFVISPLRSILSSWQITCNYSGRLWETFIWSKLGQNPSDIHFGTFARIKNLIWDQLQATKAEN